jgi:hypothetical protein
MKTLDIKEGWLNRNVDGLPKDKCEMIVLKKDSYGEDEFHCQFRPFNKDDYDDVSMPDSGYLGDVRVIKGRYAGIGFNIWNQNDSEFIYYKLVD